MPATQAELVNTSLSESIVNGFLEYRYTQTYQTVTDERTEGEEVALSATGLPVIGQTVILSVSGLPIWCKRRVPSRQELRGTARKWYIVCEFDNNTQQFERDVSGNPVTTPTEATKRVDISYIEFAQPIDDAHLRGYTLEAAEGRLGAIPVPANNLPFWISPRLDPDKKGAIITSTGTPVEQEREAYRKVISVSSFYRDWNNEWDNYTGVLNEDEVTITESDVDGVRWQETYQPLTLKLRPPRKENIWRDGVLYFRRTLTMEHNRNTWIRSQLDADTKRRLFEGQSKPTAAGGGTFSIMDLEELEIFGPYGFQEITTTTLDDDGNKTKVAVGDRVLMNGFGMEHPVPLPPATGLTIEEGQEVYLNFDIYDIRPYAPLDL